MAITPRPHIFHPWFTLAVPVIFLALQVLMELVLPNSILNPMVSENGPHELAQFMLALFGALMAFKTLFAIHPKRDPFLFVWVLCFALGCSYIAAEEISWGQSFFAWGTPDYWAMLNDQNETNLHNTSSWLDQKPKLLVLIGILIGGLIMPLMRRFTKVEFPARFEIIYPPVSMMGICLILIFIKATDKMGSLSPAAQLWTRGSEIEELYIFYYLLLYIIQLRVKIFRRVKD